MELVRSSPAASVTGDDHDDMLTPDDLLSFAWQISSGMVRTFLSYL